MGEWRCPQKPFRSQTTRRSDEQPHANKKKHSAKEKPSHPLSRGGSAPGQFPGVCTRTRRSAVAALEARKNLAPGASPWKRVLPHGKPRMGRQKILRCPMAASRGVANSFIAPRAAALGPSAERYESWSRFPTAHAVGYDLSPLSGAFRRAWVRKIRQKAHGEENRSPRLPLISCSTQPI